MKKHSISIVFLIFLSQIAFGQNSNLESQNIVLKEALNKFPNLKIDEISNFSPNWSSQSRVDYFYKESEFFEINRDRAKEKFWEGFAISTVSGAIGGIFTAFTFHAITNIGSEIPSDAPIIKGLIIGSGVGAIIGIFVGWGRVQNYKKRHKQQAYPVISNG